MNYEVQRVQCAHAPWWEIDTEGNLYEADGSPVPVEIDGTGYRAVEWKPGSWQRVYVLMAATFLGPKPLGCHTRHLNSVKTDDRLCNLSYGTPEDNRLDNCYRRLGPTGKCRANVGYTPIYRRK